MFSALKIEPLNYAETQLNLNLRGVIKSWSQELLCCTLHLHETFEVHLALIFLVVPAICLELYLLLPI